MDGFVPRAAFTKAVLDTVAPSGHGGIFQINPWRRFTNDRCVPDDGGCSRTLAPEAHENVALAATVEQGARAAFSVTVPAHSATLVTLTRAESDADLQEQTHDLNPN